MNDRPQIQGEEPRMQTGKKFDQMYSRWVKKIGLERLQIEVNALRHLLKIFGALIITNTGFTYFVVMLQGFQTDGFYLEGEAFQAVVISLAVLPIAGNIIGRLLSREAPSR